MVCASWRLLEIRADKTGAASWAFPSSTASFTLSNTRQFIWGERYIDELVAYMSDTAATINTDGGWHDLKDHASTHATQR